MDIKNIDSYTYPDTEYSWDEITTPAHGVRRGDKIHGRVVAEVKAGTKWAHALDKTGDTIIRVTLESEVTVLRRTETAQSRERYRRVDVNRRLAKQLAEYGEEFDRAREKLNSELDAYHYADYNTLGTLLEAQAERRVWAQYESLVDYYQEHEKEGDLASIFEEFCDELKKRMLERYSHRALSRSTAVLHNLLVDVDNEVIVNFLSSIRWWM